MSRGSWRVVSRQRDFMDDLARKLNITNNADWYQITNGTLKQHGLATLLKNYNGSFSKLLKAVYPEYLSPVICLILQYTLGISPNFLISDMDIGTKFPIKKHS